MATSIKKTDNMPAIVKLFDDLQKFEGKAEGIGRDIVIDLFNNAVSHNLTLLAVGNASTINSEARKTWLETVLPDHAADVKMLADIKKPGKGASIEQNVAYEADRTAIVGRIERRRAMINRAVPAAFYLFCRNAEEVHFIGSKKNKIMFNFVGDAVDTVTTAPVLDKDGKAIAVKRMPFTHKIGDMVTNGEASIKQHQAKLLAANPSAVKVAATRKKPAVTQASADEKKPMLEVKSAIETEATLSRFFQDTTGDKLKEVAKEPATEVLLCNMVRARFGKFDPTGRTVKSIDIGEIFTWLKTQNFFTDVVWTGHATTAELVKKVVPASAKANKVSAK